MTRIGILTISDRASRGEYEDASGAAIEGWLKRAVTSNWQSLRRIVPDGVGSVADAMIALSDRDEADLLLTTGGTGPAPRDRTPEAMREVIGMELPGFGELMRRISFESVATAILSRQTAGVRGRTLIINLPGKPTSIEVCLGAVFPAIPYCLELIGASPIDINPDVCKAFQPM